MSERMRASGLVVLTVAMGIGVLSMGLGILATTVDPEPNRLTDVLSKTIETRGIDAAVAEYRTLREQGFPGVEESNADTNGLGYELLGRRDTEGAVKVLQLNVETHPGSSNAHDSLGEAYLAAGKKELAIESYRRAVAIAPRNRSAIAALQKLTDFKKPPYAPLVLFHISAGALGLLSGAVAMSLRKGSHRHGVVGNVFVVSMLCMSATGAYIAFVEPNGEVVNVLMGVLTFYLVATAWLAARRRNGGTGLVDWVALLVALLIAVGFVRYGVVAESLRPVFFVFGAVAMLAATGDFRMIARGGLVGAQRIARHLWRVSTALFIAVTSLFLGQPQLFPDAVRRSGLLALPGLLVVVLLVFWLIRVLFTNAYKRAASPKAKRVVGHVALPQRPGQAQPSVSGP